MPSSCQFAAFSATYTPQTLEVLERRFGAKAVYITATAREDATGNNSSNTVNKVPSNIKVYNLRVPQSVANTTSLLKQVRAKLILLEPLLTPFLPGSTQNDENKEEHETNSSAQVLIFHNYKVHSQMIVDHIRAKVRQGKHHLNAVFLNAEQSQTERILAFQKMRVLKLRCVVSTDLMSRGVDLPDVQVVINFDLP